jgi:5,5'-dehydrodivanillate O-demethylase oxygenase subunit
VITAQENELLTRVGPGTPMGELQRRYWHPIGAVEEMSDRWTKRVRLLGEDLVLFKDRSGKLGLIAEFCPHRRASLAYGIPQADGIRCAYHGWKFGHAGECLEQPNEPAESTFKDKIGTAGYPVKTLGGMIFAYLGPLPAPLLPRWPGFVKDDSIQHIGWSPVRCNWLQVMENSLDPVHTEWLHGHLQEFIEEQRGSKYSISRKHLKIDFAEFEYGIYKRRLLAGAGEDSDDWRVGHPVLFPNVLAVGSGGGDLWTMHEYQMRVPVDDENTMHYWYSAYVPPPDADVPRRLLERVPLYESPVLDEHGEYMLEVVDNQDIMAWETQGRIAKRDLERLGTTDRGVILLRNLLKRELAKVEAGHDPIGVIRDVAENEAIEFPLERNKVHYIDGFENLMRRRQSRNSPFAQDLCDVFAAYGEAQLRKKLPPYPMPSPGAATAR